MRLWADVLTPAGAKVGDGPVMALRSASVARVLDGAGSVSIEVPGTDKRAIELLQSKRRLVIYAQDTENGAAREIGRGVIDDIDRGDAAGGWTLSAGGPDILAELKYTNTLFARTYNQQSIASVVSSLVGLAAEWGWADWTSSAGGTSNLISARYDAATVLKALQSLVSQQGLHLRMGLSGKQVEVGAFGESNGLRIIKTDAIMPALYENDEVALISTIKTGTKSEALATWLLPLAGGQNVDSALTLEKSTRTGPYPILTMSGPDGRTLYYIKKQTGIDAYGIIPQVGTFKEISPITNSDTDIRNAANALYDAAVAWLDRYSVAQETFTLTVRKCRKTVRPGDKVRITYIGEVETDSGLFTFREIDGDYWVMKATERFGMEWGTVDLEVSSIDRYMKDAGQVIIGALEQIRVQGMSVQPTFCLSPYGPYQRDIDSTHAVNVPLRITDSVFELSRALLQIKSGPFRANAKTVTAHTHLIMRSSDGTTPGTLALRTFTILEQSTGTLYHFQAQADVGASARFFDAQASATNTLDYGIYDDTDYPDNLTIKVDGVTVASGLDPSGTGLDFSVDIKDQLLTNLRSTHTINITCGGGQGELEISFELYPIITPFKLG